MDQGQSQKLALEKANPEKEGFRSRSFNSGDRDSRSVLSVRCIVTRRKKPKSPNCRALFWNDWDTLAGPGMNGSVEVFHRASGYFTVVTNNALAAPRTVYGPYPTFDKAIHCRSASALYVGPGTTEVGSSRLPTDTLLRKLKIYLPEDCADETWCLTVNGQNCTASRAGLVIAARGGARENRN